MKKKFLLTLIIALLVILTTGCGKDKKEKDTNKNDNNTNTYEISELTFNVSSYFEESKYNKGNSKSFSLYDENDKVSCWVIAAYRDWVNYEEIELIEDFMREEYNISELEKVTYNGKEWTKGYKTSDDFNEYYHGIIYNAKVYLITISDFSKDTNTTCNEEIESVMNSAKFQ